MTGRERLAHPLDDVPSIKLKLGFVIAVAVAVTVFVFWVGLKVGLWPSVSGVLAAVVAMLIVRFLARGMTSPLREMADVAGRGRRARAGVQPDGGRARRDRPRAPRPRRQRLA
jgi:hypothetical protein